MPPLKSKVARDTRPNAREAILAAAQIVLQRDGFANLSTRRVAAEAGVPLSQIHYHFGCKDELILALLDRRDDQLLERQAHMYASGVPLSERWRQACDFLDQDIASGYVRLLQECIAQGWSNPAIAEKARRILLRWLDLLTDVAEESEALLGGFAPFTPREIASMVAKAFIGAESTLLLSVDEERDPIRGALRKVGDMIENLEKKGRAP